MFSLQKAGGIAAVVQAVAYIVGFVVMATLLNPGDTEVWTSAQKLSFVLERKSIFQAWTIFIYGVFGIALVFLTVALHEGLHGTSLDLMKIATPFGLIWAGLVIPGREGHWPGGGRGADPRKRQGPRHPRRRLRAVAPCGAPVLRQNRSLIRVRPQDPGINPVAARNAAAGHGFGDTVGQLGLVQAAPHAGRALAGVCRRNLLLVLAGKRKDFQ